MTQQQRLGLVLGLNIMMISGLVLVGLSSHSLGVLAAGGDFAADSTSILLGIIAIEITKRAKKHSKATIYVALINALILLMVTLFVMAEGAHRFITQTPKIEGLSVLIVSSIATLFMATCALILGKDSGKEDLHMRSVLLDTISDGVAATAVAISGGIIYFTGNYYWLDSALAVLIGIVISFNAIKLLRDVVIALRANTSITLD